jgi:hypothetical protein
MSYRGAKEILIIYVVGAPFFIKILRKKLDAG